MEGLAAVELVPSVQCDMGCIATTGAVAELGASRTAGSDELWVPLSDGDEQWITPPGSPLQQDFDMHAFAAPGPQAPVLISLVEALGLQAIQRMDAACVSSPPASGRAVSDATPCPRCQQYLTPCPSSGVTCVLCAGAPTPGGQALRCDQCGAEVCCTCMPTSTREVGDSLVGAISVLGQPTEGRDLLHESARSGGDRVVDEAPCDLPASVGDEPRGDHPASPMPSPSDEAGNVQVALGAVAQIVAGRGGVAQPSAMASVRTCHCGSVTMSHCVSSRRGRACANCPNAVAHRRVGSLCNGCDSFRCLACSSNLAPAPGNQSSRRPPRGCRGRRSNMGDGGMPSPAAPVTTQGNSESVEDFDFGQFPPVFARPPAMWLPRPVQPRVSEHFIELMESALDTSIAGGVAEVQAHRLLKLSGQLLLRVDRPATGESAEEGKGVTLTTRVRERLDTVEHVGWKELLDGLLHEVQTNCHSPAPTQPGGSPQAAANMQQAADEEWSREVLTRGASRGRVGATRAASQILAGSLPVPPGPDATAATSRLFVTQPDLGETVRMTAAVAAARQLPTKTRPSVQPKHVTNSGRALHAPAAPGPWGFRNSYICTMLAHPRGPRTLARWTNFWASGSPRDDVARVWESSLAHPFYKADGAEVRPVVCSEALLKFPVGCIFSLFRGPLALACGHRQFGGLRADGAALMLADVRGAAHLLPQRVIAEGDAANAFGSVSRAEGLEIVLDKVPALAPLLAAIWQVMSLTLWLNDGGGGWVKIDAYFGVLHGGHDGQPVFCLIVTAIERDFDRHISASRVDPRSVAVWKYVDDGVLQCEVHDFPIVWQAWAAASALHRIVLVPRKSLAYVPAWDLLDALPGEASLISDLVALERGGIVLLGGVAEGAYAAAVGQQLQIGPIVKRSDRACRVSRGLVAMANAGLDTGGRQPAWQIARLVVANSLTYDARVNATALTEPFAQRVRSGLIAALSASAGVPLVESTLEQVFLPRFLGGFEVNDPVASLPRARVAHIIERGPTLRAALRALAPHADESMIAAAEAIEDGAHCLDHLRRQGVMPSAHGIPDRGRPSQDPLRPPCPARHLQRSFNHAAGRATLARLLASADGRGRARLHSCGGPSAGRTFIAVPLTPILAFNDLDWSSAVRWRLGLPLCTPSARCQLSAADADKPCGAFLDLSGDHPQVCGKGPGFILRHDPICDALAWGCIEAGAHTRREAWVRGATRTRGSGGRPRPARLDVWAFGTLDLVDELLDVVVKHPAGNDILASAASRPAAAADVAEQGKWDEYSLPAGRNLVPFGVETWGRLGTSAEAFLGRLHAASSRRAFLRGQPVSRVVSDVRAMIDAVVHKSAGNACEWAINGLPGGQRRPPRWSQRSAQQSMEASAPAPPSAGLHSDALPVLL